MVVEARLAVLRGQIDEALEARQRALLARFGLPTALPPMSADLLREHILRDKKVFDDAPRWILPLGVGLAGVSTGFNDMHFFAHHLKIPTLGYGPGGQLEHAVDERARVKDLVAGAKIYTDLLTTFAG